VSPSHIRVEAFRFCRVLAWPFIFGMFSFREFFVIRLPRMVFTVPVYDVPSECELSLSLSLTNSCSALSLSLCLCCLLIFAQLCLFACLVVCVLIDEAEREVVAGGEKEVEAAVENIAVFLGRGVATNYASGCEDSSSSDVGSEEATSAHVSSDESSCTYYFGASTITLSRIHEMVEKGYFAEGEACAAREDTTPEPGDDEAVIFEDFFSHGFAYASARYAHRHSIEVPGSAASVNAQRHGVTV
jgi:hypothetical protein